MKTLTAFCLLILLAVPAWAQPWPKTPPQIGQLFLKQEYWNYMKEAAERYHISPYLIQAVCAIESRFVPDAHSGRCFGLMQLHQYTAKKYGVDSHDPRQNIMGGAAVLASLMQRYDGDICIQGKFDSSQSRSTSLERDSPMRTILLDQDLRSTLSNFAFRAPALEAANCINDVPSG